MHLHHKRPVLRSCPELAGEGTRCGTRTLVPAASHNLRLQAEFLPARFPALPVYLLNGAEVHNRCSRQTPPFLQGLTAWPVTQAMSA